jgi:extradiol dioxygenase family protein
MCLVILEMDHTSLANTHMTTVGAILEWKQFQELAQKLKENKIEFIIPPQVRYAGKTGEQLTMFFLDPSGNALEFKAFKNEEEVFHKQL